MQNYESDGNRASRIKKLPKALTPEEIVDCISDFEQSAPIIDLLHRAVPEYFASDEFAACDTEHRKEQVTSFRFLMDVMMRIQEYQRRTYNNAIGTDFWEPCTN